MDYDTMLMGLNDIAITQYTEGLEEFLASTPLRKRTAYLGIDCTAPSLHVGHLVPILAMQRFCRTYQVEPHYLLGKATALIGDITDNPSKRPALTEDVVDENCRLIEAQLNRILGSDVNLQRNYPSEDFLESLAPYVSVHELLRLSVVKNCIENSVPLTLAELCYPVLQANDFRCYDIQFGGSDQWGNICIGISVAKRRCGDKKYGVCTKLLTYDDGSKMGKSNTNKRVIWLDRKLTSVFDFWQFFRNVKDTDLKEWLGLFTTTTYGVPHYACRVLGIKPPELDLSNTEIINECKVFLADYVTTLVHGIVAALEAKSKADEMYGGIRR
jgi:tyrosyl-tRNA synthetase